MSVKKSTSYELDKYFVNCLREVMGLDPLFDKGGFNKPTTESGFNIDDNALNDSLSEDSIFSF